jgi:hypothetical protein
MAHNLKELIAAREVHIETKTAALIAKIDSDMAASYACCPPEEITNRPYTFAFRTGTPEAVIDAVRDAYERSGLAATVDWTDPKCYSSVPLSARGKTLHLNFHKSGDFTVTGPSSALLFTNTAAKSSASVMSINYGTITPPSVDSNSKPKSAEIHGAGRLSYDPILSIEEFASALTL